LLVQQNTEWATSLALSNQPRNDSTYLDFQLGEQKWGNKSRSRFFRPCLS